jgi:glycine/D-amino acid oxidase-like deaminating enzyme
MFINQSPWLHQLHRTRPVASVDHNHETDVAIIGGGIAGIATAYFTLKNTDKRVTLVEAWKIAHGATGHNGGFLASYFERTFSSLVQEFGLARAAQGQQAIESAWTLLEAIRQEAKLQTPVWQFTGYAAFATLEEIIVRLRDNALRLKAGLAVSPIMVSAEAPGLQNIPTHYKDLYTVLPKQDILSLLETKDDSYIAALPERKGCMNSALFCEELVGYLLKTYPTRFALAEHTPVRRLVLKADHAVLDIAKQHYIAAKKVVLCTNGFENIDIVNTVGASINENFHYLVRGIIGYMAGYTEELKKSPIEISYLPKQFAHGKDVYAEEPYFYLTRRPFETETKETHNLICIGGPEVLVENATAYDASHPYPERAKADIDRFLRETYQHSPSDQVTYKFLWHGLMGFTPNGIRLIGSEPCNPVLSYNLGCNGVGLLPSIYGGQRIAQLLAGEKLELSIFDPKDIRQHLQNQTNKKTPSFTIRSTHLLS